MKLHSEISVGWLIVFISVLLSLSGGNSNKNNFLFSDNVARKKDPLPTDYSLIENYTNYVKLVDSARTIILKWHPR